MPEASSPLRLRIARGALLVAAPLAAVLALLLVGNWLQVRRVDPLASPALESLRARLRDNPQDQRLREEIRALDLLARRAFFASQWQQRAGGMVLLGALAVAVVCARVVAAQRRVAALRAKSDPDSWWSEALHARRVIAIVGCVILAVSLFAALAVRSSLDAASSAASGKAPAAGVLSDDDWPAFRGPGGNGVAHAQAAPLKWDGASGRGIAWKAEVPLPGRSSPIVTGERVFITGADETKQEVFCFARATGELRWRRPVVGRAGGSAAPPQTHPDTGRAAPTMASDGARLFAIFPTGDLAAFDLDGNPLWSEALGVPENHYGHASSLIVSQNLVIVQWDQSADAKLLAYEAATGRPAWRTARDVISWASPIVVDTGSRPELLVANSLSVASYDPRTGAQLWRSDCLGGEVGPSPAYADGLVFVANDRARAAGVRPGGEIVWEYKDELPDTASPVAAKGFVFLATSYGVLVCLDAQTGRELWKQDLGAGWYASPVVVGERLYALDLKGVMHIVRLAPTFERLGQASLGEAAVATPAFVGGRIYARGERFLYAIAGE